MSREWIKTSSWLIAQLLVLLTIKLELLKETEKSLSDILFGMASGWLNFDAIK